jgi:hypothetical protein
MSRPWSLSVFAIILALMLTGLGIRKANLYGDVDEYALTTIALVNHGTPDIRPEDIVVGRRLMPQFSEAFDSIEQGINGKSKIPKNGFYLGRDGRTYAIHFFAYSALATIPYKLLEFIGIYPLKCFQFVNLGLVFILGLILFRLYGSAERAMLGVTLFMLCGGLLYWNWSSPECMTAAALLGGLVLFMSGAPLAGSMLAGLSTMQNPSAVFFFVFAPLLHLALQYRASENMMSALRRAATPPFLIAVGLGLAVSALAPLFNYIVFDVPNIIAILATDFHLISLDRLNSFFFDLNQGMIVGLPGVLLALIFLGWRNLGDMPLSGPGWVNVIFLGGCVSMTIALAVPALAVTNWNSGASGMMRYAFWAGMPLLFVLLWRLRYTSRWPTKLIAWVVLFQLAAMICGRNYSYLQFSPQAKWVMTHFPAWYNPEIEIFTERSLSAEGTLDTSRTLAFGDDSRPHKTLYFLGNFEADIQLCGQGRRLSSDNLVTIASQSWRYINGPVLCSESDVLGKNIPINFGFDQFINGEIINMVSGWSIVEQGGGKWNGVWSDGHISKIKIHLDSHKSLSRIAIVGHYYGSTRRTRVNINGEDYGWRKLEENPLIDLKYPLGIQITIELNHEAAYQAPNEPPNSRRISFFLNRVALQ